MEKKECMGCQTSFQEGQKLIMENLTTEYKHYQIPLKDNKHKWTILKTITSFLNCKGGTIYIGVEDKEGAIHGIFLERKQRDNFSLFLKHLIEKIHPKVDLSSKEEVLIQYVPVFKDKNFQGKYVIKIIVQQGDPSQTYYLTQRIRLDGNNGKIDEFQVYYGYLRHNMGGTQEYKGVKLLQIIQSRAKNPNSVIQTFHQNCNPNPPHLEVQINKISFANIEAQYSQILQQMFQVELQKMDVAYTIKHLKDKKMIQITVQDEEQFKLTKQFVVKNLVYLNEALGDVKFQAVGDILNYFLIQNAIKHVEKTASKQKVQKKEKIIEKKEGYKFPYQINKQENKKEQKIKQIPPPRRVQEIPHNFSRKHGLTFTHINPSTIDQLEEYLRNSICRKTDKNFIRYLNTLQVFLKNQNQMIKCAEVVLQRERQLANFGFHQQLRFGFNQGMLRICNYDKNSKEELKNYMINLMKEDLKHIQFFKEDRKFSLACVMNTKQLACEWLDILLKNSDWKKYKIKGKGNETPKLKVYLQVILE